MRRRDDRRIPPERDARLKLSHVFLRCDITAPDDAEIVGDYLGTDYFRSHLRWLDGPATVYPADHGLLGQDGRPAAGRVFYDDHIRNSDVLIAKRIAELEELVETRKDSRRDRDRLALMHEIARPVITDENTVFLLSASFVAAAFAAGWTIPES